MAKVADARIDITAKDKTKVAFQAVQSRMKRLKSSIVSVQGAMVLLSGTVLVRFANEALKSADAIGKFSDRAGVTTSELQKLRYAFDLAGVSSERVDKSLLNFGKRLGKARQGIGALAGGLKGGEEALLEKLKATESTSEALNIMFKAMGDAETATKRLALSDAAFANLRMTAAFTEGSDAFFKAKQEAEALGIVLSDDLINQAEELSDRMGDVGKIIKNSLIVAFMELAPLIQSATERFIEFVRELRGVADLAGKDRNTLKGMLKDAQAEVDELQSRMDAFKDSHLKKYTDLWFKSDLEDSKELVDQIAQAIKDLPDVTGTLTKKIPQLPSGVAGGTGGFNQLRSREGFIGKRTRIPLGTPAQQWQGAMPMSYSEIKSQQNRVDLLIKEKQKRFEIFKIRASGNEQLARELELEEELGIDKEARWANQVEAIHQLTVEQEKFNKQLEFQNRLVNMAENVFDRAGDGMLRALQRGEDAFVSFKNVAMAALFDIGREMTKMMVFDPLKEAVRPALSGIASSIGAAIGGSLVTPSGGESPTGGMGWSFPEHAHGGFAHGGKPSIVGEQGAELFLPRVGGQIIPNDQLGGGGVNVTLNLTTGIQSTVRAEVMGMMPMISSSVKNAIAEARQRGGSFSEAMGV